MKLQDYRETFYTFSGKASDLNRQFGFGAIALIWLFKQDIAGRPSIPHALLVPSVLVVSALLLDMLQYMVASAIWYNFYRRKEKEGLSEEEEITHSPWLERPTTLLFAVKVFLMIACYGFLLVFLLQRLVLPVSA